MLGVGEDELFELGEVVNDYGLVLELVDQLVLAIDLRKLL